MGATRDLLGENLSRLMAHEGAHRRGLNSNEKLAKRIKVSSNTVGRIRRGENAVTLDVLERLAAAFELDPWQLLVAQIDPSNPPALRAMTEEEQRLYDRLKSAVQALENR